MSNGMGGAAGLSPDQLRAAISQLSSPDTVDSPFGRLDFFDGVPTPDTVSTAYDALDLIRGIEVFLGAVPGASLVASTSYGIVGGEDSRCQIRPGSDAGHVGAR